MKYINGKAITDVIYGQPYYFGTVEDRSQAQALAQHYGGDKAAFHKAMDAAGLQWGDTSRLYDDDWSLEALTARQRALARYGIYQHRQEHHSGRFVKEQLEYAGLRLHEAEALCEKLNEELWAASPDPERARTAFGGTMHGIQLERPVPPLWTAPIDPTKAVSAPADAKTRGIKADATQHALVTSASTGKSSGMLKIVLASI